MARRHVTYTAAEHDEFVTGCLTAAFALDLYTGFDDDAESGVDDPSEYEASQELNDQIERAAHYFILYNLSDLLAYARIRNYDAGQGTVWEYAGHDFWLTANGHGAGFWDRYELPEDLRDRLTNACPDWVGSGIYVGDDGLVYGSDGFDPTRRRSPQPI